MGRGQHWKIVSTLFRKFFSFHDTPYADQLFQPISIRGNSRFRFSKEYFDRSKRISPLWIRLIRRRRIPLPCCPISESTFRVLSPRNCSKQALSSRIRLAKAEEYRADPFDPIPAQTRKNATFIAFLNGSPWKGRAFFWFFVEQLAKLFPRNKLEKLRGELTNSIRMLIARLLLLLLLSGKIENFSGENPRPRSFLLPLFFPQFGEISR